MEPISLQKINNSKAASAVISVFLLFTYLSGHWFSRLVRT